MSVMGTVGDNRLTLPREGKWIDKPLRRRFTYSATSALLAGLNLVAGIGYVASHPHQKWAVPFFLFLHCVLHLVLGFLYIVGQLKLRQVRSGDRMLSERPPSLPEFPVEISIQVGSSVLGGDRGVIYFDGGLLGFVGTRTSFIFAATDVALPEGVVLTSIDTVYRPLKLRVPGRESGRMAVLLTVKPLMGFGRRYRKCLRQFLLNTEPTDRPRQWPPLVPFADSMLVVKT